MKRLAMLLALVMGTICMAGCDDDQESFDADDTGPSSVVPDGTPGDADALDN